MLRHTTRLGVVCLLSSLALSQSTPVVSSVSPNFGPVGTSVTISGSGFGDDQGSSTLSICNAPVTPSTWSDTSIIASVPAPDEAAGICDAIVIVNGTGSPGGTPASRFDVSPPSISGPSITFGAPGDMVFIQGSN